MSDTRPEIKVRSEGGQVVVRLGTDASHYWDIPLSNDEAIKLASTIYAIAMGIEAMRIKEEREANLAADLIASGRGHLVVANSMSFSSDGITEYSSGGRKLTEGTQPGQEPETWRDRESML